MPTGVVNLEKDPYDVYIGQPLVWGNPIRVHDDEDDETPDNSRNNQGTQK